MKSVVFRIDRDAGRTEVLAGNRQMRNILDDTADELLSNIQAQFFVEFGVEGSFMIEKFITDRSTVKIAAADAKTGAILKAHPGWLDYFTQGL